MAQIKINNTEISEAFLKKNSLDEAIKKLAHIDAKVVTEFHKHYNPQSNANIGVSKKVEAAKLPSGGTTGGKG
jgi:hypothetical protein